MKIIVMDSANVRIEVLNVADHMLEDEIELFLYEHGYSLNNISWMAAPIDYVPVQFHEYDTDKEDGEEVHTTRNARLKDFSIYDSVQEIKRREQEELAAALRLHGTRWMMVMSGTSRVNVLVWLHTNMTNLAMWLFFRQELIRTENSPSLATKRTTEAMSMRLTWTKSLLGIWTSLRLRLEIKTTSGIGGNGAAYSLYTYI